MPSHSVILTYLFAVALLLCSGEHAVLGQTDDVHDCYEYSGANTTSATCNKIPDLICSGGCTGYVTAKNCKKVLDAEGKLSDDMTTQNCTLGFGKSSAFEFVCISKEASFTCYNGDFSGKAQCKGCHTKGSKEMTMTPTTPAKNPAPTGMGTSGTNGMPNNPPTLTPSETPGASGAPSTTTSSASTTAANVLALLAASIFPSALIL